MTIELRTTQLDIYNSKDALKLAFKNYWEIDKLCSGEHTQHDSTVSADYIDLLSDLKIALRSVPRIYRYVIFWNLIAGYPEGKVGESIGWTQQKVHSTVQEGLEIVQSFLQNSTMEAA